MSVTSGEACEPEPTPLLRLTVLHNGVNVEVWPQMDPLTIPAILRMAADEMDRANEVAQQAKEARETARWN